jgi:hypothetical protein
MARAIVANGALNCHESYKENLGNLCINVIFISVLSRKRQGKQDRQYACRITFRRVRVTIVELEKQ